MFVTNAATDDLSTEQIVELYLDRWPKQEPFFRDARNGGGLNRSHGYGGAFVRNVAVEERRASAERSATVPFVYRNCRRRLGASTKRRPQVSASEMDSERRSGSKTPDGATIATPDSHVNGVVDVAPEHDTIAYDPKEGTCTGSCHREDHNARRWVRLED